jgi:hypothetical protein
MGVVNDHATRISKIIIDRGEFFIVTLNGAGIGGGEVRGGNTLIEMINIHGGMCNVSTFNGAGIGADYSIGITSRARIGSIVIEKLQCLSMNANNGAGIGAGQMLLGQSHIFNSILHNGIYEIVVSSGSGIGAGRSFGGLMTIDHMLIENGSFEITANSGSAIGTGYYSGSGTQDIGNLEIRDGHFDTRASAAKGRGSVLVDGGSSSVRSLLIVRQG